MGCCRVAVVVFCVVCGVCGVCVCCFDLQGSLVWTAAQRHRRFRPLTPPLPPSSSRPLLSPTTFPPLPTNRNARSRAPPTAACRGARSSATFPSSATTKSRRKMDGRPATTRRAGRVGEAGRLGARSLLSLRAAWLAVPARRPAVRAALCSDGAKLPILHNTCQSDGAKANAAPLTPPFLQPHPCHLI